MRVLGFGDAPQVEHLGYGKAVTEVVHGSVEAVEAKFQNEDVVLVQGAAVYGTQDVFEFAVFRREPARAARGESASPVTR